MNERRDFEQAYWGNWGAPAPMAPEGPGMPGVWAGGWGWSGWAMAFLVGFIVVIALSAAFAWNRGPVVP